MITRPLPFTAPGTSTANGRDSAYIAVHQYHRMEHRPYFDAFEAMARESVQEQNAEIWTRPEVTRIKAHLALARDGGRDVFGDVLGEVAPAHGRGGGGGIFLFLGHGLRWT
mgnify:CR=1 FL=1